MPRSPGKWERLGFEEQGCPKWGTHSHTGHVIVFISISTCDKREVIQGQICFVDTLWKVHTHIYIHTHTCLHACAHTHAYSHTYTHAYAHIHTVIHAHTHVYTHSLMHTHAEHAHTRRVESYSGHAHQQLILIILRLASQIPNTLVRAVSEYSTKIVLEEKHRSPEARGWQSELSLYFQMLSVQHSRGGTL